jgi:parvulin-like peptidyl-prolyl isomerase
MVRCKLSSVLLLSAVAAAQVASHAPTVPVQPATTAAAPLTPMGRTVARVNGTELSDRDLLRQMMNVFPYARQHGGHFPREMEADIRRNALDQIEFEELVYQEALRRKLTVAPARLNRAMHEFRAQFDMEASFQSYLAQEQGGSLQKLRSKVRRAILIDQLLTSDVTRKAIISEAQLRTFYSKNPDHFRKPESVSLQTISLVIPDNSSPTQKAEVRKRAEHVLSQAKATKDYEGFGLLAEKFSEDDWRVMMGDHKSIHRGRMPAPVEKVVFTMQAGQVSDIIEAENSFCIARVNAREESKLISFEEVRVRLKKDLESEKEDTLKKAMEARLRKNAKIEEL